MKFKRGGVKLNYLYDEIMSAYPNVKMDVKIGKDYGSKLGDRSVIILKVINGD